MTSKNNEIKATLLRLRTATTDMLREQVQHSAHRSMSALADDLLQTALADLAAKRGQSNGS